MPLHHRSIAVNIAAVCFFGIAVIGSFSGLSPFTCCQRALAGSVVAYVVTVLAVKAINAILMDAMIKYQINKQKEKDSGGKD